MYVIISSNSTAKNVPIYIMCILLQEILIQKDNFYDQNNFYEHIFDIINLVSEEFYTYRISSAYMY